MHVVSEAFSYLIFQYYVEREKKERHDQAQWKNGDHKRTGDEGKFPHYRVDSASCTGMLMTMSPPPPGST